MPAPVIRPHETGTVEGARAARDRFLSEFTLSLSEGVELGKLLPDFVAAIGGFLDVDRVALFLIDVDSSPTRYVIRAVFTQAGVPPIPAQFAMGPLEEIAPTLRALRPLAVSEALSEVELQAQWEFFRAAGTRSLLAVPIGIDGSLRGVVTSATVGRIRDFAAADIAFVESAARHLAAAFKQADLLSLLGRERDRLRILFDLSATVHRSPTIPDLMRTVLAGLQSTLRFPAGGFGLLSADGREIVCDETFSTPSETRPAPLGPIRIPLSVADGGVSDSALARSLVVAEPLVLLDINAVSEDPLLSPWAERLAASSLGFFPLSVGGRALGLLVVGCDGASRKIEAEDVETLQSLADVIAVTLEERRSAEAAARAVRYEKALAEASRALLTRTASRDVLLNQLLDALVSQFGQKNCRLLLIEPKTRSLVEIARRGDFSRAPQYPPLLDTGPIVSLRRGWGASVSHLRGGAPGYEGLVSRGSSAPGEANGRGAHAELVVPLALDGEVVGVFDLRSDRPFAADDVRILQAFADRAALALNLSDLVSELERRTRVLESVARATQLLNFRLFAPDILASFVEEISRAFPKSDGCVAYVASEDGHTLSVAAAYGLGRATMATWGESPIPIENLFCAGRAFRENQLISLEVEGFAELMPGARLEDLARVRSSVADSDVRHLLAAPIRVGDRRLGVIEVLACRKRAFTESDAETFLVLADQAAIALRNARVVDELKRSNRLKDDFLANLSHELKTPLTGIVGWAEVLLDMPGDDARTRRPLESILGQAETLKRMLEDLIDLSRIENFGLEIQRTRIDLTRVLSDAVNALAPIAGRRHIAIVLDLTASLPPFDADGTRLKQVFWNLLANGVKFSPVGATVTLTARKAEDGGIEFLVVDHGAGIDASFLPHVFERFRQEDSSHSRKYGGLGIGLSITKAIVEAHGGTLEAFSEGRGRGSRFTVRFPADKLHASGAFMRPRRPE